MLQYGSFKRTLDLIGAETENVVLGILGGAAGIAVGYWTDRLLEVSIPALPFGEACSVF
jgi:hypothetical protein